MPFRIYRVVVFFSVRFGFLRVDLAFFAYAYLATLGMNECTRIGPKQEYGAILEFLFHHQNDCPVEVAYILQLLFKMATIKRKAADENTVFNPAWLR